MLLTNQISMGIGYQSLQSQSYQAQTKRIDCYHLPIAQDKEKCFTSFNLMNIDTTERLKGGEIGFIVSQTTIERKIISFAQRIISKAPNNSNAVHAFVVTSKEDENIIRIAEANDPGLKESTIDLRDLDDNEALVFFQPKDELLREIFVKNVSKSVDLLPTTNFRSNPDKYEEEFLKNQTSNYLYSMSDLYGACVHSVEGNQESFEDLVSATADCILGQNIRNRQGQRKSFICSAFATLTFQASWLECELTKLGIAPSLGFLPRDTVIQQIKQFIKQNPSIQTKLKSDKLYQLNYRWVFPATLKHRLEQVSHLPY